MILSTKQCFVCQLLLMEVFSTYYSFLKVIFFPLRKRGQERRTQSDRTGLRVQCKWSPVCFCGHACLSIHLFCHNVQRTVLATSRERSTMLRQQRGGSHGRVRELVTRQDYAEGRLTQANPSGRSGKTATWGPGGITDTNCSMPFIPNGGQQRWSHLRGRVVLYKQDCQPEASLQTFP